MISNNISLLEAVATTSERLPDKTFLQEVDGDSISYRDFHLRALRWAGALEAAGVQPGDRVATMLMNCIDGFVFWAALSWVRAIDTAVSVDYRGSLLAHVLNLSGAAILFTESNTLDALATCADELNHLRVIVLRDSTPESLAKGRNLGFQLYPQEEFLSQGTALKEPTLPRPWDITAVIFTSGTTGPSKGSLVPWRQLATARVGPRSGVVESDVLYHTGSPSHMIGRYLALGVAEVGASLVLKRSFKTQDFWHDVDKYGCTFTSLVGAMSHFLISQPPSDSDAQHSLRAVGMTPVHPRYLDFRRRFRVEIATSYGMTECLGPFSTHEYGIEDPSSCGRLRIGWPFFEARLVDENDEEVPTGQVGELIVRTGVPWAMTAGYLGMPERTAEAWRNGWFHTGDAFRRDEKGLYFFTDRLKDAIRRRGENISSFEVEIEVNKHPAVAESAAIAVPADNLEDEIKVFVVAREGQSLDPEDLIRFLTGRMARYMIPRYVEIVSDFPKTHTLRVKKAELRARPAGETWDRVAAGVELK